MKKYFFSIISVLILAVLTSCSGLTDSYSQVSVEFPEGTSNQLTLLRAADNTSSNITCLLKTTGDYEATATATYSSAEELNNKQITISGIPVNKTIAVKLQLLVDNQLLYEGISEKITVQKGDNLVNMKIKPAKVEVSFETAEFGIAAFDKNGKNTGNKLMYNEVNNIKIAPVLNDNVFNPANATIEWTVDNNNLSELDPEALIELGYNISEKPYLKFYENALDGKSTISVKCVLISNDYSGSTSRKFNIKIDDMGNAPYISNTEINTYYLIQDKESNYYESNSIDNIEVSKKTNTSEVSFYSLRNGTTALMEEFTNTIKIYDIENNYLYKNISSDPTAYVFAYSKLNTDIYTSNYSGETIGSIEIPSEYLECYTDGHLNKDATVAISNNYFVSGKSDESSYILSIFSINNHILSNEPKTIELKAIVSEKDYLNVIDSYIIKDKLFMLFSICRFAIGPYYQQGGLYIIDLNNPDNRSLIGFTNDYSEYAVNNGSSDEDSELYGASNSTNDFFYAPQRITAIKKDEVYIADVGIVYNNSSRKYKKVNRIMCVNLSDFALSCKATVNSFDFAYISDGTGYRFED